MTFTNEEKLTCVQRELKYRRRVYKRRIDMGTMSQELADRETALMEEIVADYQKLASSERLL
jgi:hypothetical protein